MKEIVLTLVSILMIQCKKDDTSPTSVVVDTYFNLSVFKKGEDVLNPTNLSHYNLDSMRIEYTDNLGNSISLATLPLLYEQNGIYYLRIFSGYNKSNNSFVEKQNINIVWSDKSVDVIQLNLYKEKSGFFTKSILLNKKEVWNEISKVEKKIVISK